MDCIVDRGVVSCHPLQDPTAVEVQSPTSSAGCKNEEHEDHCQDQAGQHSELQDCEESGEVGEAEEGLDDAEVFSELGEPGTTEVGKRFCSYYFPKICMFCLLAHLLIPWH